MRCLAVNALSIPSHSNSTPQTTPDPQVPVCLSGEENTLSWQKHGLTWAGVLEPLGRGVRKRRLGQRMFHSDPGPAPRGGGWPTMIGAGGWRLVDI